MIEENGNDVAVVENQGRMRGQVGVSTTTSSVGMQDSGQGRDSQFSSAGMFPSVKAWFSYSL